MSLPNEAKVEVYDDGKFVRTAIVVPDDGVSFDLVDTKGNRIAEINAFAYYGFENLQEIDHVIVDVIDKDDLFGHNNAVVIADGKTRSFNKAGRLISADFRKA